MYIHIVMEKEQEEWKTRLKNEEIRKKKKNSLRYSR